MSAPERGLPDENGRCARCGADTVDTRNLIC